MNTIYKSVLDSMCRLIDDECERYSVVAGTKAVNNKKSYGYIPVKSINFMYLMELAFKHAIDHKHFDGTTFIDAGCGPGWTLKMAKAIGFDKVEGVENNPIHVKFGRRQGLTIHEGDINKFDFSSYSVIYSYVPLLGRAWDKWTVKVSEEALPGTIFVGARYDWVLPRNGVFKVIYDSTEKMDKDVRGVVIKKVS